MQSSILISLVNPKWSEKHFSLAHFLIICHLLSEKRSRQSFIKPSILCPLRRSRYFPSLFSYPLRSRIFWPRFMGWCMNDDRNCLDRVNLHVNFEIVDLSELSICLRFFIKNEVIILTNIHGLMHQVRSQLPGSSESPQIIPAPVLSIGLNSFACPEQPLLLQTVLRTNSTCRTSNKDLFRLGWVHRQWV